MVLVHFEVSLALEREGDAAVVDQLVEHMVEEVKSRVDGGFADAVEIHGHLDVGLAGLAADRGAAHGTADPFGDLRPAHRPHLQCRSAQVGGQLHVALAVADHETGAQVVAAVHIGGQQAGPGLAGRGVVLGKASVYEDIVEYDTFSAQRIEQQVLAGIKRLFREGGRAEAVLVAHHHQFESQPAQGFHPGDGAGDEGEFLERVDLLVGGFGQQGAVPVDK